MSAAKQRPLRLSILWFFAATLWASSAYSTPSLNVVVNPKEISVGQSVQLNVQAVTDGLNRSGGQLEAPELDAWQVVSQMRRTSFDSSQNQRITVLDITLRPTRTGDLTIGAFRMTVGKTKFRSQPVIVKVRSSRQSTQSSGSAAPDGADDESDDSEDPEAPDDLVYLEWLVDVDEVWLGQPIEARLFIYFRDGLRVDEFNHGKIDLTGFWNEADHDDTERPRRVQVGEQLFIRDEIAKYTLYPLRAGILQLPELNATMSVRRSSFFTRRQSTEVARTAPALDINVKALPKSGRPKAYRGLVVGNTRLIARLDRSRIRATEGVEFSIETRIQGMLQNVPELELPELPHFQVFPSKTETSKRKTANRTISIRRQSWLLRPRKGGRLKLPSLSLPYFDPGSGIYRTARTKTMFVNVSGTPKPTTEANDTTEITAETPLKLNSIRTEIDNTPSTSLSAHPLWFMSILFGVPLLFIGGLLRDRIRASRDASAGSRAARGAAKIAMDALNDVQLHSPPTASPNPKGKSGDQDNSVSGYEVVHRILMEYLTTRFEEPFNGKTYAQVSEILGRAGIPLDATSRLTELLEALDYARFARANDPRDLERTVQSAVECIQAMEARS